MNVSASEFATERFPVVRLLIGSVALWLAFPPVGWSLLAWVAPALWLRWVALAEMPTGRPYRSLWLAGIVFWLLAVHWIRLPHPLNYLGWLALAVYLGLYLPVFVFLARVAVHRLGLPLVLSAPVVWTGLDFARGHLLTGFLMGSLAHTQYKNLAVIQIADIVGEYGVTFLIVMVATVLAAVSISPRDAARPRPRRAWAYRLAAATLASCVLALSLWYGSSPRFHDAASSRHLRVALIQGNILADWKSDAAKQQRIMDEYVGLSREAVAAARQQGAPVDLVIWPETSFRLSLITLADGFDLPKDENFRENYAAAREYLRQFAADLKTAVLVGVDRLHVLGVEDGITDYRPYNSSVLVDREGNWDTTYDKMHRVVFGEYIPFAEWFPVLYRLTPLTGGITAGEQPECFEFDDACLAPNICYETVVPHLIRRQVRELTDRRGSPPDVLVNLTNDAWFWGSSELDMHLACGVFRAVEMRTPLLVAANGGLSGYVDSRGAIRAVSNRQQPEHLLVDVDLPPNDRPLSPYARGGDWFAIACVVCCTVLFACRILAK